MSDAHPGTFEGFVDRVEDGWVTGWAWAPGETRTRVAIELRLDGETVATCPADLYRPDLERAGKRDGRHAFEVALPADRIDGMPHELRVVYAGTDTDLVGSPRALAVERRGSAGSWPRNGMAQSATYRSRFGGLWTDLAGAPGIIDGKLALGWISPEEAALLRAWVEDGFVILTQAVPHTLIDRLDEDVERIWRGATNRVFVEWWENDVKTIQPAGPRFRDMRVKLLDLYSHLESAREIVFAPAIVRFLTLVFERPAMAFQSLYFRYGSQQDIHQDSAFVKVSSPMEFAASWVALEDIRPDSGELEYYVGSHRLADYLFEGTKKWMPFRSPEYDAFIASLPARSDALGLERARFLPKKGDVLLWSADLAHGGRKNAAEGLTRKSLVTHYCPSSCEPVHAIPGATYPHHKHSTGAYYTVPQRD